jgi:hypothetical protein
VITIERANLRDASWITHNLRSEDREEVYCQLPDGLHHAVFATWLLGNGEAFIAYSNGNPVLLFGTSPITVCALSVWAMGVPGMERSIPEVSRFLISEHIPYRIKAGFNNMEARSHVDHVAAHRWIESMGGERHGPAYVFGRGGEHFITYRWTVSSYRAISGSRWAEAVPKERVEQ